MKNRPLIIGIGGTFENTCPFTMSAIKKTISAGVDGVFVNVALTKDKMPVVIPSTGLSKIIKLDKNIDEVDFSTICKTKIDADCVEKGYEYNIPTITEVIDFLNSKDDPYLIVNIIGKSSKEINETLSLVSGMVQDIKPNNTFLASNSIFSIKNIKKNFPTVKYILTMNNYFPFIHYVFSASITYMYGMLISPSFSSSLIADHKSGKKLFTKIDDMRMIDDAISIESDFILTPKSIETVNVIKEKWRLYA